MTEKLKVNSVNVKLGPAVKYSNIPTGTRGHKISVCVSGVDEDGKAGYWEYVGKVITGLGRDESEAFKCMIEGCIKTTNNLFNTDTITLIKDVINDHNMCVVDRNYSGKYYFDKEDRIVSREWNHNMDLREIVKDYVKDLLKDTMESYKKMTPDEKEMFVRDMEEDLDDTIEELTSEFNLELCVKMYGKKGDYRYFMLNKDIYYEFLGTLFEDTYREMFNKMIEE